MSNRIAKLLSFVRGLSNDAKVTDVVVDIGGGDNRTAQHFSAPGDDSFPLTTDYALTSDVARSGSKAVHGYVDPINDPAAQEGDKRIYGRDPNTGLSVNQVWLKSGGSVHVANDNGSVLLRADGGALTTTPGGTFDTKADGSIKGDNGSGSFELQAGGNFVVNNVVITPAGDITTPAAVAAATMAATTSLTVASKEMAGHTHSQANDGGGDSQVNTSGPI